MGCGASAAGTGGQVVHRGHGAYDNVVSIVLFAVTRMQVSTVHCAHCKYTLYSIQYTLYSIHYSLYKYTLYSISLTSLQYDVISTVFRANMSLSTVIALMPN